LGLLNAFPEEKGGRKAEEEQHVPFLLSASPFAKPKGEKK